MSNIWTAISGAAAGVLQFGIGFVLGLAFDLAFYRTYLRIDPDQRDAYKLTALIIVQLFLLFFLVNLLHLYFPESTGNYLRLGVFSSQLFLLDFAMDKFADFLYDRDTHTSSLRRMVSSIPGYFSGAF